MSDHVESGRRRSAGAERRNAGEERAVVEVYETDGNVVFFDAENPLAWLEAGSTVALNECA